MNERKTKILLFSPNRFKKRRTFYKLVAKKNLGSIIISIIIVLIFILIPAITTLITDYWWFEAVDFSTIFKVSLFSKIILFFTAAIIFSLFLGLNLWLSSKMGKKSFVSGKIKTIIMIVIAFFVGLSFSTGWLIVLKYFKQVPFNVLDPLFAKDVSFYLFSLPFLLYVLKFLLACVVITLIIVALNYLQSYLSKAFKRQTPQYTSPTGQQFQLGMPKLQRKAQVHLAILGALFFILLSVRHYLAKYSVLYSKQGIVVGAGYTDINVYLPVLKVMLVLAIVAAVALLAWTLSKKFKTKWVLYVVVLYLIVSFVGPTMLTGLVQSLKVSPNEINLEKPYIEDNIEFTKIAYGLNEVEERDYPVNMSLNLDILEEEAPTINNVRLLDWRPLTQTYKQTQEIRLYYDLSHIDIDRYYINGEYTQVMLSPREMNQNQITNNAQTWVNLHMVYTHGFGAVMSPVNKITSQGLPVYYLKDIPPINTIGDETLNIDNPRIYYGQRDNNFVLVTTETEEFDYPKGDTNSYNKYAGNGGVMLDSALKNLFMALRFGDIKILLSSDVTSQSKIMFDRQVQQRIKKITPFLELDQDPYIVLDKGRIFWIQDAYTTTNKFPYSETFGPINYMRNSVKVVVDAYNGDVTYYISDVSDALIKTYANVFPGEFKALDEMPQGLRDHVRYPEDFFKVQSKIYSTYHMTDPVVFYNKEDAWQIPNEIYGTGQRIKVDPYYIIMELPEIETPEFILMTPFTPIKKDNMISWMAARSDGENYGELILYKFPKDKLIYGPSQIEAKFDQDSDISEQLTLWSQQGSRVTRGNLLAIPVADSMLYIEPLYMQSEQGQLPQLKRVLVSDGEDVVMEETLEEALIVLFTGAEPEPEEPTDGQIYANEELIQQANDHYTSILQAMQNNDWASFGESFDKLGEVLEQLEQE